MLAGLSDAPPRKTTRSPCARTDEKSVKGRSRSLSFPDLRSSSASLPRPFARVGRDDAVAPGERIGRHGEIPLRLPELGGLACERLGDLAGEIVAIEVPPAAAVGDEVKRRAVRRPFRLEHGFGRRARARRACDDGGFANHRPVVAELRNEQCRAVPRHVGMIPGEPREPPAVGRQARRRKEVVALYEDLSRARSVRRQDQPRRWCCPDAWEPHLSGPASHALRARRSIGCAAGR